MVAEQPKPTRYPLLETLLALKGLSMQGTFTLRDVADLFAVSTRTIQVRIKRGDLRSRNLPGRAKFLPFDVEQFLQNSSRSDAKAS